MEINELSKRAYKNAEKKGFFDMKLRIIRKMKKLEFDEEEINFFVSICKMSDLMGIVTEVSEAAEELRKGNTKEHWLEVGDILIRTMTYSETIGMWIKEIIEEKMAINEGREKLHGKLL